jgi:hypothetical protein
MQHLYHPRFHTGALACGKYDCGYILHGITSPCNYFIDICEQQLMILFEAPKSVKSIAHEN